MRKFRILFSSLFCIILLFVFSVSSAAENVKFLDYFNMGYLQLYNKTLGTDYTRYTSDTTQGIESVSGVDLVYDRWISLIYLKSELHTGELFACEMSVDVKSSSILQYSSFSVFRYQSANRWNWGSLPQLGTVDVELVRDGGLYSRLHLSISFVSDSDYSSGQFGIAIGALANQNYHYQAREMLIYNPIVYNYYVGDADSPNAPAFTKFSSSSGNKKIKDSQDIENSLNDSMSDNIDDFDVVEQGSSILEFMTELAGCFSIIGKLWNYLFSGGLPFGTIITISAFIGVFGFIVNSVQDVSRSASRARAREQRKKGG